MHCISSSLPWSGHARQAYGKETRLFAPFVYKNDHLTKTGSRQTWGKLNKGRVSAEMWRLNENDFFPMRRVRKTPLFLSNVYINASFYQDRLGTNLGKALKKEWRFSHQAVELENQKKEEEGIDKLQVRTYCPGLTDAIRCDTMRFTRQ